MENVITEMATCGLKEVLGATGQLAPQRQKRAPLNGSFFPLQNSDKIYSHRALTGIAVNEKIKSTKSIILIRWSYFENGKAEKQGNVKTIDD